jgi:hypothetical protein
MAQEIRHAIDTISQDYVEGWALGPIGPCLVEVLVDGRLVGQATTGLQRDDVGSALPEIPRSADAGFIYVFTEGDLRSVERDFSVSLRLTSDRRACKRTGCRCRCCVRMTRGVTNKDTRCRVRRCPTR